MVLIFILPFFLFNFLSHNSSIKSNNLFFNFFNSVILILILSISKNNLHSALVFNKYSNIFPNGRDVDVKKNLMSCLPLADTHLY